ncbi:hypothetical protein M5K25_019895 [Dendrobium thyrsiflorum]|uniref:Uncharacterized protein n=1 Tax=Dendrobium thyrsiflorum TaxID=117978 RepID=A0ABD0UGW2_DENTH
MHMEMVGDHLLKPAMSQPKTYNLAAVVTASMRGTVLIWRRIGARLVTQLLCTVAGYSLYSR